MYYHAFGQAGHDNDRSSVDKPDYKERERGGVCVRPSSHIRPCQPDHDQAGRSGIGSNDCATRRDAIRAGQG